jgi:hypothetical protein
MIEPPSRNRGRAFWTERIYPLGDEPLGRGESDPRAAPGDDGDLNFELPHGMAFPLSLGVVRGDPDRGMIRLAPPGEL